MWGNLTQSKARKVGSRDAKTQERGENLGPINQSWYLGEGKRAPSTGSD